MALAFYYVGQHEKALETLETTRRLFPSEHLVMLNSVRIFTYLAKYKESRELFENSFGSENLNNIISYYLGHVGIAYFNTGEKSKSSEFLNELLSRSNNSPVGSPSFLQLPFIRQWVKMTMLFKHLKKLIMIVKWKCTGLKWNLSSIHCMGIHNLRSCYWKLVLKTEYCSEMINT